MVKLFKKGKQSTETFKFETSLKIKSLPMEEYTHIAYAFQVAMLRFERMLKESLLEGYVTSATLEKITREFKIGMIRKAEIPSIPSIIALFGSQEQKMKIKEDSPVVHVPTTHPTPSTPPISPQVSTPTPTPTPIPTNIPTAVPVTPPAASPKISFSFPETSTPTPSPNTSPTPAATSPTAPTIPKISFPSMSKPITPPSTSLAQKGRGKEEDRATGIAILRKQMLTELKKIRSVVSEEQR